MHLWKIKTKQNQKKRYPGCIMNRNFIVIILHSLAVEWKKNNKKQNTQTKKQQKTKKQISF